MNVLTYTASKGIRALSDLLFKFMRISRSPDVDFFKVTSMKIFNFFFLNIISFIWTFSAFYFAKYSLQGLEIYTQKSWNWGRRRKWSLLYGTNIVSRWLNRKFSSGFYWEAKKKEPKSSCCVLKCVLSHHWTCLEWVRVGKALSSFLRF